MTPVITVTARESALENENARLWAELFAAREQLERIKGSGTWYDDLKFVQRVLESHAPEQDRLDALEAVRRVRKDMHQTAVCVSKPPESAQQDDLTGKGGAQERGPLSVFTGKPLPFVPQPLKDKERNQ